MPERKDPATQDLRAKAIAEGAFRLVEELTRKIARSRNAVAKNGLMEQTSAHLEKVRRFVVGADKKKLTPHTAHRITGEYMTRASQLEDAVLEAEVEGDSVTDSVAKLKEAFMPIPRNKLVELQPMVTRKIAKLHGVDEARGVATDPAWTVFFYDAALKHSALPNFNGDEWYGEAMSQRSAVLRKLVLPLVAYDMLNRAAQEGALPMPNKDTYMMHRHRAVNAIQELVELWDKEMPAVADKYRAVLDSLDREEITLSLYYRYQEKE